MMRKSLAVIALCILAGGATVHAETGFLGEWIDTKPQGEVVGGLFEGQCPRQKLSIQPHGADFRVYLDNAALYTGLKLAGCARIELDCSYMGSSSQLQCELSNPEMGPLGFAPVLSINSTTGCLVLENAQGEWDREFVRINNE
ncbi:hypothetical protein [Saezia sanguinis]|nr:hypothetical protein [Saezia sanguinis]